MMDMLNYAVSNDQAPSWMRTERYEYWDHFNEKKGFDFTSLRKMIAKLKKDSSKNN